MNAWKTYLKQASPARRKSILDWYSGRPKGVQSLVRRYPPGTTVMVDGKACYVVGVPPQSRRPGQ
jgi:hypothetical protein